jgi:hypothetical protein
VSEKKESLFTKSVLIGWILITLFTPFAVFYYVLAGNMASMGPNIIYALLWAYIPSANLDLAGTSIFGIFLPIDPSSVFYGFHILNPLVLLWAPVNGFFNILFAVQVIRYIQDKTSMKKTIIAGVLTFTIPLYQAFLFLPHLLMIGHPYYIGPIPIQLVVGLLIARKYGPKSVDAPWE